MSGRRVTIPVPRGKKDRPTIDSKTLLLPEDCPPTTTICGKSIVVVFVPSAPGPVTAPKTSCNLLAIGINWSMVYSLTMATT